MEKCILIYDDDESLLFLCKSILKDDEYAVETRLSCENVINDIDIVKPDIILMDLFIPQIGGEAAITLVKDNPITKHIPVIVFSANAELKEISEKIKADGYLEKPFNIRLLKETVRKNIL